MIEVAHAEARESESSDSVPLAASYRELRSISVRALLEGQADAAKAIADRLPRKLSGKRKETGNSSPEKATSKRDKRLK